jgi:glycosyltransferase involved in cell wall biosynthesis
LASIGEDVKPRLLYVHSSTDLYGSDRSLLRMVAGVAGEYDVTVAVPTDGPLVSELCARGADVRVLPLTVVRRRARPVHFYSAWTRGLASMVALLREVRPHLVHSNTLAVTDGALAARLLGMPHVWHVREYIVQPAAFRPVMATLAAITSRVVVANSLPVGLWFAGGGPLHPRVRVIHNGLEYADVPPRPVASVEPGRPLTAVLMARINSWKGHGLLIRALASLPPAERDLLRVVFAGDVFPGNEHLEAELRAEAARLAVSRHVEWRGFVPDPSRVLADADVLVVASETPEPFGNVMLEAMEVGLPVVATAHGGPLDVIVQEETGLLVPPQPEALAAALVRLAGDADLRSRMGAAGWRRARTVFSQRRTTEALLALYTDVIGGYGR